MSDKKKYEEEGDDLSDFEEDAEEEGNNESVVPVEPNAGYAGVHSSGFRDFLLKPELLRAIKDSGFEHPSEVQQRCIPQTILGTDVICQAKSGMGKTAVFVLTVLQRMEPSDDVQCLVMCHARELAFQISDEFTRFSKQLKDVRVAIFLGGINVALNRNTLKNELPNIVVGTPGRIKDLLFQGALDLSKLKYFVLDECDKMLESDNGADMRRDVQEIFKRTPKNKQVMMFSATMSEKIRDIAKKFMVKPMEVLVDSQKEAITHSKLTQYYVKLTEREKNKKLVQLLDSIQFNQVIIFVRTKERARELNRILNNNKFPSIAMHGSMNQEQRLLKYKQLKKFEKRILVATDLVGRGIDIQKVNVVINYDMADDDDSHLHRVARAGRFGTKGLAISFVSTDPIVQRSTTRYQRQHTDEEILKKVQARFFNEIKELPDTIDSSDYSN